jgi:hypothetical protein
MNKKYWIITGVIVGIMLIIFSMIKLVPFYITASALIGAVLGATTGIFLYRLYKKYFSK